jgi:multiple antibiotic resistance protein
MTEFVKYSVLGFSALVPLIKPPGTALEFLGVVGWQLLSKPDETPPAKDPGAVQDSYWQSRAFYPLTFPITVGPGSVAIMLTLSAQANSLDLGSRIPALMGLFACVGVLSAMLYAFCAYAPVAVKKFPGPVIHGVLRIVAFLVICIGAQIAWYGLHTLLTMPTT